ncbi:MAG: hypothetical protein CML46_08375 [Rhodobacteraceae bacterium]|nr:hypothetical protein [Paracoccaceae bacterium]MBR26941.1 hypothetical protein [Paracoccaceae bacterium]
MSRFRAILIAAGASLMLAAPAHAIVTFEQGFETDTAGFSTPTDYGAITLDTASPPGPHAGAQYARVTATASGPYTFYEGPSTSFNKGWTARAAMYLDPNWAAGEGFEFSLGMGKQDNTNLRDFIFHVAKDADTGTLLVNASNNTDFDVPDDLDTAAKFAGTSATIGTAGWYVFEHDFQDQGGVLAGVLNVYNAADALIFSRTLSNPADDIAGTVGGHRYGWFTTINVAGGLAIDSVSMATEPVPLPAAAPLLAAGVGLLGLVRVRRRRRG